MGYAHRRHINPFQGYNSNLFGPERVGILTQGEVLC